MKRLLFLPLAILPAIGFGQYMLSKADSLRQEYKIKEAITEYRKTYLLHPNQVLNTYNFACALAVDGQVDSAFKYLAILEKTSNELSDILAPLTDVDFYSLRKTKQWPAFEDYRLALWEQRAGKKIANKKLAKELLEMQIEDQAYRKQLAALKQQNNNSQQVAELVKKMKVADSMNLVKMEKIIAANGWPKFSDIGPDAANTAFLVIQHSDYEHQKKYLSTIKQLCEQKEADWESYALMYDRVQVHEKNTQLYGTQVFFNKEKQANEFFPIEDKANVETRRKQMGMMPLKEYASMFGISYTGGE